jgi:hypothetical protein
MIVRQPSSRSPVVSAAVLDARPSSEPFAAKDHAAHDEIERDRAIFLQPARLDEARRRLPVAGRRWGGLLIAGLAALAIGVGEVRAESEPVLDESAEVDYWAWLLAWFDDGADSEAIAMRKNEDGTSDPGEGE